VDQREFTFAQAPGVVRIPCARANITKN